MIRGYLQEARQRLHEFGGFWQMDPERLPGPVGMWADSLWVRAEPGLTTLVTLVPAGEEGALRSVRDGMAILARDIREAEGTEVQGILLIVTDRPLSRDEYESWQELKLHDGPVRVVPWVVDLARGRVFDHQGPPFGVDPDLMVLAAPEPAGLPPEPPARPQRREVREPRPWGTIALLGVIIVVWIAMTLQGGSWDATQESDKLLRQWGAAARPDLWLDHEPWRLFTAIFIHIGIVHMVLNGLSLWWVGRPVEILFGSRRMLYIFLVSGVIGSAASAVLGQPLVLSAGASGAIFGLLGAVIWYRVSSPLGERIAWRPLLVTLGLNLGLGLALHNMVDNWNHIGGLVGGVAAAAVVGAPRVAGLPLPRFHLPRTVRILVAAAVLLAVGVMPTGAVELPGRGRDLARALTALDEGRLGEAEAGLRRAAGQQPDQPELHLWLLDTYLKEGKCREAAGEVREILALVPDATAADKQELQRAVQRCESGKRS